jgi:ABC-type multidrug transport system ATPase subunit
MTPCAIVTENLVKRYRRGGGLNGFSLSVPTGATMGLVGRNGAGKTTWMMIVAGFVMPTSGLIDILHRGAFSAARHGGRLSILPQDSELPLEACVRELLVRYARLQGLSRLEAQKSADSLIEAFNLGAHADKRIRALSHGMRKRVMVAQAFIGEPDIVLLDEPLSGLDPVEANRMRDFIRARRGRQTMVISSHNLVDIEKLCTHVAFIDGGKLKRFDTLSAFTSASGRIVYSLRRRPDDFAALERLVDGITLGWNEESGALTATFSEEVPAEDVNAKLLPSLVRFGVVSVVSGRSLEEAYLRSQ